MTNRIWAVVVREPEEGKLVAFAYSFTRNQNLVGITAEAFCFKICGSKKEAVETAEAWNESYKKNGVYAE